ncbi:MAG TPA: hypothetical protein VK622_03030 [Puia sp.]|nr:hypothetical protein [Puia sp.]
MQTKNLLKAGLLGLILVTTFILGWEGYWRSRGYVATYNDDKVLWANKRHEAYQSKNKATVFIGSSRIKFDLDIPTWESVTGEKAVQLALVGTSPRLLLEDLANDKNFNGKLVMDVTEVLFFSDAPFVNKSSKEAIGFYHKQTPSEKISSLVDFALESKLAFLEESRFSLSSLSNEIPIQNRPGVFVFPSFPKSFSWTTYDRQTYIPEIFLTDSNAINQVTAIWAMLGSDPTPAADGNALTQILQEVKTNIDKIRSRGGKVILVRTPSSGPFAIGEAKKYPKEKYWRQLVAFTKTEGIHYQDNPVTKVLTCPEWSHLAPKDAVTYTKQLVQSLEEKGWFTGDGLTQNTLTN